jgi:phage-related protein
MFLKSVAYIILSDCHYTFYDVYLVMEKQWEIELYSDANGTCELADWLTKLKLSHRDKVLAWIDKLQEEGPLLPRPYADLLKDGIHELRVKVAHNQVRILYFFIFENRIVLTHRFIKNTSKVPEKEIKRAQNIRSEYIERSKNEIQ